MLNKAITPSFIVKYLDQYVIGQDDAKKTVAVTVYSHFKKIAKSQLDGMPIAKSNMLLIGPSGTGKTLLCETLSLVLGVPFATAEATALAQSRYVNEEIEAVLQRLVDKAGGDVAKSQNGMGDTSIRPIFYSFAAARSSGSTTSCRSRMPTGISRSKRARARRCCTGSTRA